MRTATQAVYMTVTVRGGIKVEGVSLPFTEADAERLRTLFQLIESGPHSTREDKDAFFRAFEIKGWVCEKGCGQRFVTYAEAEAHEAQCRHTH